MSSHIQVLSPLFFFFTPTEWKMVIMYNLLALIYDDYRILSFFCFGFFVLRRRSFYRHGIVHENRPDVQLGTQHLHLNNSFAKEAEKETHFQIRWRTFSRKRKGICFRMEFVWLNDMHPHTHKRHAWKNRRTN